jgi:hypothetical protein
MTLATFPLLLTALIAAGTCVFVLKYARHAAARPWVAAFSFFASGWLGCLFYAFGYHSGGAARLSVLFSSFIGPTALLMAVTVAQPQIRVA